MFGEGADGEKLQAEDEDEEVLVALLPALAHAGSGKERLQVQTGPSCHALTAAAGADGLHPNPYPGPHSAPTLARVGEG